MIEFSSSVSDRWGPRLSVLVGRPLGNEGWSKIAISSPQRLLVDTGAAGTWVSQATVDALNLPYHDDIEVFSNHSNVKPSVKKRFRASLQIYQTAAENPLQIAEWIVNCGEWPGQEIDGMLGRDFLSLGTLSYFGRTNIFRFKPN